MDPAHPLRQGLGRPCGRRPAGRHLSPLYRPPDRPRGGQPAGLRGAAQRWPESPRAGTRAAGGRPQRGDVGPRRARIPRAPRRSPTSRRTPHCSGSNITASATGRQGICHIVGPEQGFTLPGVTLVCGDSHTATHGAFGALAFGIGTSEVEHVLATQTLIQKKSKTMRVTVDGPAAAERQRQGPDPVDHRRDRHRRRHRLRAGICRRRRSARSRWKGA